MKKYILILFVLLATAGFSQPIVNTVYADTFKVTKRDGTPGEFVLKNSTKNILGFLKNVGGGRTEFVTIDTFDSSSLSARIDAKLNKVDTASLSNRIDLKLNKTDTANLSTRINLKLNAADTASLSTRINLKLNATDTASLSNRIDLKLNKTDTANLSTRINLKLNAADTASLSNRIDLKLNKTDTASLSTRIDAKISITTAASTYLPLTGGILASRLTGTSLILNKDSLPTVIGKTWCLVVDTTNSNRISRQILPSGTVTNVAALTLGTSGTDFSSTIATGTTTPVITLNVPDASATARGVVTTGTQTFAGVKTFSANTFLSTSGITRVNNSTVAWQGGSYTPTFAVFGSTSARALIHASDNTGGQVGSLAGTSVFSGTSANFDNIFSANNTYTTNTGASPSISSGAGYSFYNRGNGGYYNYLTLTSNGTNSKTFNGFGNYFYYQTSGGALNLTGNLYGFRSAAQFVDPAASGITVTSLSDIILENPTFTSGTTTITERIGLNIAFNATNISNAWGVYQSNSSVNNYFNGNTLIGTTTNVLNNKFKVATTTGTGHPFPNMTSAQRTALTMTSSNYGDMVYQTDGTEGVYVYKSTGWVFAY